MSEGWLELSNIDKLIDFSRKLIYYNFDEDTADMSDENFLRKIEKMSDRVEPELEQLLPFIEIKSMFMEQVVERYGVPCMSEDSYDQLLVDINQRMISNIVLGLVKKGVLDTAFDSDKNDFVFWVKNQDEEEH